LSGTEYSFDEGLAADEIKELRVINPGWLVT
jgi:hypothetical protein